MLGCFRFYYKFKRKVVDIHDVSHFGTGFSNFSCQSRLKADRTIYADVATRMEDEFIGDQNDMIAIDVKATDALISVYNITH